MRSPRLVSKAEAWRIYAVGRHICWYNLKKQTLHIRAMLFDWDEEKAKSNLAKHSVSFDEATSVFDDPLFLTFADPEHSSRATFHYHGRISQRTIASCRLH